MSQTQDIFGRVVRFEAIGGGTSNAALYVIGGIVALAAIGLVLLVVALVRRRRTGGPASGAPEPKTVEAKA